MKQEMSMQMAKEPGKKKTYNDGLRWAARWIEGSLTGQTSEEVIEFAKAMAMSIRAAQETDFSCRVCGVETAIAPDPPALAVCPDHCEDHDYRYFRDERRRACIHCDQDAPDDWLDD